MTAEGKILRTHKLRMRTRTKININEALLIGAVWGTTLKEADINMISCSSSSDRWMRNAHARARDVITETHLPSYAHLCCQHLHMMYIES